MNEFIAGFAIGALSMVGLFRYLDSRIVTKRWRLSRKEKSNEQSAS